MFLYNKRIRNSDIHGKIIASYAHFLVVERSCYII